MMNPQQTELINMGCGIELAEEESVSAAITQEFLHSPATTGLWINPITNEADHTYFGIEREKGGRLEGHPLAGRSSRHRPSCREDFFFFSR